LTKTPLTSLPKTPTKKKKPPYANRKAILEEMKALDEESADILNSILELI
jgi:type I restriction enzyme M protein